MNIQSFNYDNISVAFRNDGYLHATQIAKHFGKLPKDYLKTEQTQEYIAALADNCVRRKILTDKNQLVIIKQGGIEQGTWLHPKLAIHFARWLDPKFAVWCDEQIEQIISGSLKLEPVQPALPQLNDELVLSIGRVLLHAQDMRLFVNRYLPAFECLGITNHGALWSYVHDTEPTFKRVREFFLQQTPYREHHLFADDTEWVRRKVIATAKI
ncbi:KilA-N domain-containing protein [Kingella kingae]|uniref:KilA-N domain-containing protein n=1 Tax=Kingella kingae TaxID=504 RepID=UPI00254E60BC|nr:KilA-N domain-containing protein [Kingella kingae]MDK4613212.1 KilA-N domain-containing protein [Kingella kingae]MDK4615328.1 KilA-N domain-containing protein [Kingella kingae]MDK4617453.1 KilA-N domain-containing protein [Kingella kingae]MDK4621427.1 KilA-N domain-containing protein [Kingella kingae]MDK4637239.1 KilA-N domain-containing protein [Kingella kingae]